MPELVIERVPLDSLIPHPRNVRHGDVGAIVQSLEAHGQFRPLVVQMSTRHIIGGNHTWRAMKALAWTDADVTILDVTDEEALRMLLVDNRSSDLATYDDSGLADVLRQLAEAGSLAGTGYDGDDLDDLLFRLAGDAGTMDTGVSTAEAVAGYEARGIKSFVLPYPAVEWEMMNILWAKLREEQGVDNNSDAVHKLLVARFPDA
jgi:ParB/Sulfiredoxin domain